MVSFYGTVGHLYKTVCVQNKTFVIKSNKSERAPEGMFIDGPIEAF